MNANVDQNRGTVLLRAVFPNKNWQLVPGLQVQVRVETGKPYAGLLVPRDAVTAAADYSQHALVVNADHVVEDRTVKVSTSGDKMVIIREGLKPDDWVVLNREDVGAGYDVKPVETSLKQ